MFRPIDRHRIIYTVRTIRCVQRKLLLNKSRANQYMYFSAEIIKINQLSARRWRCKLPCAELLPPAGASWKCLHRDHQLSSKLLAERTPVRDIHFLISESLQGAVMFSKKRQEKKNI